MATSAGGNGNITIAVVGDASKVEVYSVDEAFVDLGDIPYESLFDAAMNIRKTVEQWTGISVSIGVAPT